jgi:hypothetical protein
MYTECREKGRVDRTIKDALAILSADQDAQPGTEAMCADVRKQLAAMRAQIQHDAVLLQHDLGSWAHEQAEPESALRAFRLWALHG